MKNEFTDEQLKSALGSSEREAEEMLKDEEKTKKTLDKAKKLLKKIRKLPVIGSLVDEIETMVDLIRCYIKGTYRNVPIRIIIAALGAIIYLVSPIDLIPDVIPIVGWLDDAAIITTVLGLGLGAELKKFRKWRDGTIDEQLDELINEYKNDVECEEAEDE